MYATLEYYRATYIGQPVADDTKLTQLLTRASQDIDIMTLNRIDVSELCDEQLEQLSNATCAQAEFYAQNGIVSSGAESHSLGSYSQSGGTSESSGVCGRAMSFLALTGLLNRAVASYPVRRLDELEAGGVIPVSNNEVVE